MRSRQWSTPIVSPHTHNPGRGEALTAGNSAHTRNLLANASPLGPIPGSSPNTDYFHANASPLRSPPDRPNYRPNGTQPGSIGAILQTFKANTTRRINRITQAQGRTLWQRNYYEHIVRHQDALQAIRAYIQQNPRSWATDQLYPKEPTPQQGRSTVDRSPTPGI